MFRNSQRRLALGEEIELLVLDHSGLCRFQLEMGLASVVFPRFKFVAVHIVIIEEEFGAEKVLFSERLRMRGKRSFLWVKDLKNLLVLGLVVGQKRDEKD